MNRQSMQYQHRYCSVFSQELNPAQENLGNGQE